MDSSDSMMSAWPEASPSWIAAPLKKFCGAVVPGRICGVTGHLRVAARERSSTVGPVNSHMWPGLRGRAKSRARLPQTADSQVDLVRVDGADLLGHGHAVHRRVEGAQETCALFCAIWRQQREVGQGRPALRTTASAARRLRKSAPASAHR